MNEFTLAIHRQSDSILALAAATRASANPTPATPQARAPMKPFVPSDRGRAILEDIDRDD
jgi:hypothetical protein